PGAGGPGRPGPRGPHHRAGARAVVLRDHHRPGDRLARCPAAGGLPAPPARTGRARPARHGPADPCERHPCRAAHRPPRGHRGDRGSARADRVHAARLGPRAAAGRGADLTALATTGIENLRPYLVGYVPQLLLSATVTPLCLLTIAFLDPISAVIAIVTLPLVPIFMILVGKLTMGRSERLIADMRSLWTQLLDLVDGLPTLRALGRERGPEKVIATLGQRHRASAMGSLK